MKKLFYLLTLLLCSWSVSPAQVTTDPSPLQEDSENVVIYFHADEGTGGLMGQPQSQAVYAHTGVDVVDAAGNVSSWKYAPEWLDNNAKYQLSYVSPNLWKLTIGNIRQYYGVPATETVKRLCFVFRNADGTKEGKATGGKDIFVDVVDAGFQLEFSHNGTGNVVNLPAEALTFTASVTEAADITISVDGTAVASRKNTKSLTAPYTFTTPGNKVVTCRAVRGSETLERTIEMVCINNSAPADDKTVPPMGCTRNPDGSYTFCIAAPGKGNVMVVGSWNGYKTTTEGEMKYVDRIIDGQPFRYFKTTLPASSLKAPFSYYYLIDGVTAVGDPYARLVLDPDNDRYISAEVYPDMPQYPVGMVPDNPMLAYYSDTLLDYNWTSTVFKAPDRKNLIIYEMLFRDFTGTEGKADGNGTVRKALAKLPYLKQLGVNAVELLPINEFNGNISWGYNPNFYFAPDKAYGTPQDYKEFIDACHAEGIAVILDMVFNQSDWQHPWYRMYEAGSNPFYNVTAPHAYSVLNDWNQGNPLVEEQWLDVVKFWLKEYKVDGFRFDLVKGLGDNDSYANSSSDATNAYNQSRVDRMKRIHAAMRTVNPDAYFINENLAGAREENAMAEDGELNWANYNGPACEYAMGYSSGSGLNGLNAAKGGRTAGSTVSYLESHDEERLAYKQINYGAESVRNNHSVACQRLGSAAAQMILIPGSHMIWQFSEMGNAQTTKNDYGNETGPKIVNWNLLNDPDNKGLYDSYSELIAIRLGNLELFPADNDFANSCSGWSGGRSIVAKAGDKELFCLINPDTEYDLDMSVTFDKNDASAYHIASKSYGSNPGFDVSTGSVSVPANCYVVITTTNISGVENVTINDSRDFYEEIYNLSGIRIVSGEGSLDKLPAGIYVVRQGDKVKKIAKTR